MNQQAPAPITLDEIKFVLKCEEKLGYKRWNAYQHFAMYLHEYWLAPHGPPQWKLDRRSTFKRLLWDVCIPQRPELARFWRQ